MSPDDMVTVVPVIASVVTIAAFVHNVWLPSSLAGRTKQLGTSLNNLKLWHELSQKEGPLSNTVGISQKIAATKRDVERDYTALTKGLDPWSIPLILSTITAVGSLLLTRSSSDAAVTAGWWALIASAVLLAVWFWHEFVNWQNARKRAKQEQEDAALARKRAQMRRTPANSASKTPGQR